MDRHLPGVPRRSVLRTGAIVGAAAAVGAGTPASAAPGGSPGAPAGEGLALINGKIHTMDPANPVVSSVLIKGDRFRASDLAPRSAAPECG